MRTSKVISTISYNTTDYLIRVLEDLKDSKTLSFWAFIEHLPEDDEAGKKLHKHLFMVPSKMLQTDDLQEKFIEFDPSHPDKPLKTTLIRSSKFGDWYLYGLHDKAYLASKGESRKYHYLHEEFIVSDSDSFYEMSKSIDLLSLTPYYKILEAQSNGLTYKEFFRRGGVPLPQITLFQRAWDLLANDSTYRDLHQNHPVMDDENNLVYSSLAQCASNLLLDENNQTYSTIDIEEQIKMAESEDDK